MFYQICDSNIVKKVKQNKIPADFITVQDVSQLFGCSVVTMHKNLKNAGINPVKKIGKQTYYKMEDCVKAKARAIAKDARTKNEISGGNVREKKTELECKILEERLRILVNERQKQESNLITVAEAVQLLEHLLQTLKWAENEVASLGDVATFEKVKGVFVRGTERMKSAIEGMLESGSEIDDGLVENVSGDKE